MGFVAIFYIRSAVSFYVAQYQAGFGAEVLELFRPSKERNKLLLRACALLFESLAESFSPACDAGTIVDDRTKPAPCESPNTSCMYSD